MSAVTRKTISNATLREKVAEELCGALLNRVDTIDSYAAKCVEAGVYTDSDVITAFPEYGAAVCYDIVTGLKSVHYALEEEGEVYKHSIKFINEVGYHVRIENICLFNTVTGDDIELPEALLRHLNEGIEGIWEYE